MRRISFPQWNRLVTDHQAKVGIKMEDHSYDGIALGSCVRRRPLRIKQIESNARLLRPTKAYLAGTTTKHEVHRELDKENRLPPPYAAAAGDAARPQVSSKKISVAKVHRRLTIPKSPNFHFKPRTSTKSKPLSMSAKELEEVAALKARVEQERKRHQRYHQMIQGRWKPQRSEDVPLDASESSSFTKTLQSCGGLGIPAVRRRKLTTPLQFELNIDRRASLKRKSAPSTMTDRSDDTSIPAKRSKH